MAETASHNETLYWTIGGVAIGLIALMAFASKGSGSSEYTASTPAVSATDLTSQVNTVNNNSAQVEQTFLNDRTALAIAQNTNQLNYATSLAGDHATTVQTHMNDVAAQHINATNAAAAEYTAREQALAQNIESRDNMLATEYEATQAKIVGVTSANDQVKSTQISTTGAVNIAQIAGTTETAVAKTQAQAEESVASTQASAADTASTNNLIGSVFSGVLGAFGL